MNNSKTNSNSKSIVIALILSIFSTNTLMSQIEIKGFITDCEGKPISGAFVMEQKTKNTTITNLAGFYKIVVPDTNTLIKYSFVGFLSKTIKAGKKDTLNVTLSEDSILLTKPILTKKPVIYLYPTIKTDVSVKLEYSGKLLFTYPHYDKEWEVLAHPNGKLINKKDNKEYSYLFWDGEKKYTDNDVVYENGFIVPKDSVVQFLQEKLPKFGLQPIEYNEFIVFWTPYLTRNDWNFMHFRVGKEYNIISTNNVIPLPETEIRIFMDFKKIPHPFDIKPQKIITPRRKGFTLVEWGGAELKQVIRIKSSNGNYLEK